MIATDDSKGSTAWNVLSCSFVHQQFAHHCLVLQCLVLHFQRPHSKVTPLALLHFSVAFACVDHGILLSSLQFRFGLDGTVLSWIRSFLSDTTQRVLFDGKLHVVRVVVTLWRPTRTSAWSALVLALHNRSLSLRLLVTLMLTLIHP